MAKVPEVSPGPMRTEEDRNRAILLIVQRLNEVIRALNTLLP